MSEPWLVRERAHAQSDLIRSRQGRRLDLDPRFIVNATLFCGHQRALAILYLIRPEPLVVQGEAESTSIDIAARVSGRLPKIAVSRGENVGADATLLVIDNPELVAEFREAEAERPGPTRSCAASKSACVPKCPAPEIRAEFLG